jgi:hypothetical protein
MTTSCVFEFEEFEGAKAAEVEGSGISEAKSRRRRWSSPPFPPSILETHPRGTTSGCSPRLSPGASAEAPQAESAAQSACSLAGGCESATEER